MINFLKKIYSLLFKTKDIETKKERINTPKEKPKEKQSSSYTSFQEKPKEKPKEKKGSSYTSFKTKEPTPSLPLPKQPLEKYLVETLKSLNIPNSKIYWNSYIPCTPYSEYNINLTEIDVALVTPKGVIVFESKDYTGVIYGDFDSPNWSVSYSSGTTYKVANALRQNYHHKNAITYNTKISRSKVFAVAYLNCADFLGEIGPSTVIFHDDNTSTILLDTIEGILTSELSTKEYSTICSVLDTGMRIDESIKNSHLNKLGKYIDNQ